MCCPRHTVVPTSSCRWPSSRFPKQIYPAAHTHRPNMTKNTDIQKQRHTKQVAHISSSEQRVSSIGQAPVPCTSPRLRNRESRRFGARVGAGGVDTDEEPYHAPHSRRQQGSRSVTMVQDRPWIPCFRPRLPRTAASSGPRRGRGRWPAVGRLVTLRAETGDPKGATYQNPKANCKVHGNHRSTTMQLQGPGRKQWLHDSLCATRLRIDNADA